MPAPSDLVHQTSTTTGTGALTLTAENGKRTFLTAFGTGGVNTFDYFISHRTAAEWERGTGHENAGTLVRDTVIASSNANAAVSFSAGTKDVTNDIPALNQARLDAANTWSAQQTFAAAINLTSGQIAFPATAVPSAGANTLDDYEEGTWTPAYSFDTVGDLSVVYAERGGSYTKIGNRVLFEWYARTTTFTYTTASGNLLVTGFPFSAAGFGIVSISFSGFNLQANYTTVVGNIGEGGATQMAFYVNGDNVARTIAGTTEVITTSTLNCRAGGQYAV